MYQRSLFGGDPLGPPTEKDVQDLLIDINALLWAAIVNPFDDLSIRRQEDAAFRDLDEGETAQWLRPQIIRHAKHIFEHAEAMKYHNLRQQQFFTYKDAVAICFKKLKHRQTKRSGSRLERSNYMTTQNKDFWEQRTVNGFPELPRIIVGYEMLSELTEIKVMVCYPRSRHRGFQWAYQMENQDAEIQKIVEEHQDRNYGGEAESPGFLVRPRRAVRERRDNA